MIILGIDPGLDKDKVAGCVLKLESRPKTLQDALRGYVRCSAETTKPGDDRPARLAEVASWTAAMSKDADVVVVEVPAITGAYARVANHRLNRKGVDALMMAMGAILAAAEMSEALVVELAADTQRKRFRHECLEMAAGQLGITLPIGPRGGKREDEMDAIWTACRWAQNSPRGWWS